MSYANSIMYASPRFQDDRRSSSKRHNIWNKFLDSLSWDYIEKKANKTVGDFKNMFRSAGVVIKEKRKS